MKIASFNFLLSNISQLAQCEVLRVKLIDK
nr:MAG TPA_asm: hypothetical protein [Caudoviricetes sp.]DAZ23896.1 MAG TPA: hypothetical protein [Caudoviricetes sp.]